MKEQEPNIKAKASFENNRKEKGKKEGKEKGSSSI
jgi:hypothetical protein